jgi:hypothetical protein
MPNRHRGVTSGRCVTSGRHRLGTNGLTHCTEFATVTTALAEHRRNWFSVLLVPARHSLSGLRRRSVAPELWWAPALAA